LDHPSSGTADDLARQRLAAIVESSDDAIVSKDLNGIITSWNRAAERIFGYTAAEAIGRPIMIIIPPERRNEEEIVLSRIRSGRSVEPFETVRVRKDGTRLDVSISVSPIKNAAGVTVGASKIARDISERRRLDRIRDELLDRERAARAEAVIARDRLAFLAEVSALLTSSLDYEETLDRAVHLAIPRLGDYCTVLVHDENAVLRHVASGHVDRAKEPIVREMVRLLLDEKGHQGHLPTFAADVAKTGRLRLVPRVMQSAEFEEVEATRPDLHEHQGFQPYSYVGVPLLVRGRTVGVIAFGTTADLSQREYSEADIPLIEEFARRVSLAVENARLFRQADELNRLKDEFLATLSHELRTPLNAIVGWSRMLGTGKLKDDTFDRAVVSIQRNAQAQAKIVDDILEVARGVAGNVRLEIVPLDLVEVAHRGVDGIAPTAAVKQITIEVSAPEPVPISGDPLRLQQVLGNMLSNAVKFTPRGGTVRVSARAVDGDAELRVTDSGIGISPAFLPHVFDKFRQADASFTRTYGGLGLGLAIARHLIELHGGTVEAQSEGEGKGATFIMRLPLDRRPPAG
jgi:PAS domain S-box-containing protein